MMASVTGAASRRVLVVEDEYLIAKRFAGELAKLGIETVGPAGTVAQALALIAHGDHLDGATLDIKVRDDKVFAVADALQARGVPFVFATGYDQEAIPDRYRHVVRCQKPLDPAQVVRALFSESGQDLISVSEPS
jgi:CheY-like chemotaxis protein